MALPVGALQVIHGASGFGHSGGLNDFRVHMMLRPHVRQRVDQEFEDVLKMVSHHLKADQLDAIRSARSWVERHQSLKESLAHNQTRGSREILNREEWLRLKFFEWSYGLNSEVNFIWMPKN
jgi:hypothetical protein